jgi:hypothetical protein
MAKKPKQTSSKWGKGKTDPATWWEKGCPSPNPAGRPKGSKNQKTCYRQAVEKQITVHEDGVPQVMSRKEATYHQIAHQASAGDLRAAAMQFELDARFDPAEPAPPTAAESEVDYATLEHWVDLREKFKVFKQDPDGAS